jgi:excisionase family DNA binding protein
MLSTRDVAKLLGVSPQTVINWSEQGRLPFQRVSRGPRRFREVDVLRFVRDRGLQVDTLDQDLLSRLQDRSKEQEAHLETLPALVLVNRDGLVVSWNEGAVRLFGFSASEILLKPLSQLPAKAEPTGLNLEAAVMTLWRAPFVELEISHTMKSGKNRRSQVVISRFYGKTTSAGGFALAFHRLL